MARRSTRRKAPRRSRSISVLNTLESVMYANILSRGLAGTGVVGLFSMDSDLRAPSDAYLSGGGSLTYVNADNKITLSEMVSNPELAIQAVAANGRANMKYMIGASLATSIGFKLSKRLLRKPLANIQRNLIKPLGIGVRI